MAASSIPDALRWFKFVADAEEPQRTRELADLKCQTPEGLWPTDVVAARQGTSIGGIAIPARPMLSIPTMDEPMQLILNGQRKAHLGVTIHPLSEDATDDTAAVLQGLYRACERDSNAHLVRSWAFNRATKCGRGWYRINKVYDADGGHPLDQKLVFKRILYQGSVYADPFAEEPDWSDGKRLMIVSDIPFATYKRRWPKSSVATYGDGQLTDLAGTGSESASWVGGDSPESRTIRVAEDWRVEITTRTWVLLDNNEMAPDDAIPDGRTVKTGKDARTKDEEIRTVYWRVINCEEEVEPEQEWDGQYIPIIFDPGIELQPFEGKRIWYGMYSTAKDGARLVNYAASGAVEMAALEPKAPWQGEEGVFEGHEREYAESNIRNFPYLQFKRTGTAGMPAEAPKRVQVDVSRLGPSMQLLTIGRDFVQTATATFDPALGKQPTAHRSGRALIALQDQTVEGTSHYLENLKDVAMMHEARVWLDLAPHVYDRPGRVARILDDQNVSSIVMLNQPFTPDPQTQRPRAIPAQPGDPAMQQAAEDPQTPVKHYDLNKGRYGVSVTISKSHPTQLAEGNDEMSQILQAAPELMPVIGPTYFAHRDFPGAKQIAKDLKKMRDHQFPWLADEQADPAAELAQAKAECEQLAQAAKQMQQVIETDQVKAKMQVDIEKLRFDMQVEIKRMENAAKIEIARITSANDATNLAAEAREEQIALGYEHAHEASMADQEHQRALQQQAAAHQQALTEGDQAHAQTVLQADQGQQHALEAQAQAAALQPEPEPTA
jgi:hypothetical protein